MGFAIISKHKTKEEALAKSEKLKLKFDSDRIFVFYEPEYCLEKPYTLNID